MNLKYSIDGGVTYLDAPDGIRVIYSELYIDGEDGRGELHLNHTLEGVVSDVWVGDENPGTESREVDDIVRALTEANS
jgi:hypothetical protein